MPVTVRSVTPPTATATINKPTGTTPGDCLIAVAWGSTSVTTPSGWTRVTTSDITTSNGAKIAIFSKIAGGSEPASYTFTNSLGTSIACFTGNDQVTPVNVYAGTAFQAVSGTSPSVTTTVANCLIYRLGVSTTYSSSWTEPSGTEKFDANGQAGVDDGIQVSAGASGTETYTQTANASAAVLTIAVAPSTGAFFTTTYAVTATPVIAKVNVGVVTRKITVTTLLTRVRAAAISRPIVATPVVSRLVPGQAFGKVWTVLVSPVVSAIRSLLPSAPVPGLMTLSDQVVTRSRLTDTLVTSMTLTDSPVE